MKLSKILLLCITAAVALPQSKDTVAAKPPASSSNAAPDKVPTLVSSRFWMLAAKIQSLRSQIEQSEVGKALKVAQDDFQKEQEKLSAVCGEKFTLGYQQDAKAENSGDVICVPKPPPAEPVKDHEKAK